jgi:hypothetical protein
MEPAIDIPFRYRLVYFLVEIWKADECCNLEDGAYLPFLVCMEGRKEIIGVSPLSLSYVDFLVRFSLFS